MKILKFYSDWCDTCKMLSSTIDSIKEEIPFEIEDVDAINNTVMAKKYNIRGVPTIIIIDGEAEVKRHIGNMTADQIKAFVTI